MFETVNEITVCTTDGKIQIEQNIVEGAMGHTNEIVIDAFQVPLLCRWLRQAAAEIKANG